jgi:hypothetical protein
MTRSELIDAIIAEINRRGEGMTVKQICKHFAEADSRNVSSMLNWACDKGLMKAESRRNYKVYSVEKYFEGWGFLPPTASRWRCSGGGYI